MSFTLTSPITGAAQTGFTAPTYTLIADMSPDGNNGKQVAVSALGGTQTGATYHTVDSPFLLNFVRPKVFKSLSKPNPTTGIIKDVPVNNFKLVTLKGVTPSVNQPYAKLQITTIISCPAGAATYDAANVKAAISAHLGALAQQSAGVGDTVINGVV